jgi:hypothetical protein
MRPTIPGRCTPFNPPTPLKPVQETGESRTLDIERLADRGLGAARIGFDEDQYGVLRRTHFHGCKRPNEILENGNLEPTQECPARQSGLRELTRERQLVIDLLLERIELRRS